MGVFSFDSIKMGFFSLFLGGAVLVSAIVGLFYLGSYGSKSKSSNFSMNMESKNFTLCECLPSSAMKNGSKMINCAQNKSCVYRMADCNKNQVDNLCQKWNNFSSIAYLNENTTNHLDSFKHNLS